MGEVRRDAYFPNGVPNLISPPKSPHRRATKGTEFPWRWIGSTTPANLDVIWGMSVKWFVRFCAQ